MIIKLVWWAVGLAQQKLAPKRIAKTNGSGAAPRQWVLLAAIGVPIAAAALFEAKLVSTVK